MTSTIKTTVGIDETKKALDAASSGFIGLKDIEWSKVAQELGDLDHDESKAILIAVVDILLKFVGFAQEYKGIIKILISVLK